MKKFTLILAGLVGVVFGVHGNEEHQELVVAVERSGTALVEDDLDQTRERAGELLALIGEQEAEPLVEPARQLAGSESLEDARGHFQTLSLALIERVGDTPGFYIMTCPMVEEGLWIQTDEEVANPYMGQRMIQCGGLLRKTGSEDEARGPAPSEPTVRGCLCCEKPPTT